jgi:tetratricopeptide (TPR) repeat protein
MPITIIPPPQRLRLTREEFALPELPLVRLDPTPERDAAGVRATLQALFPGAQFSRKLDVEAPIQLELVEADALLEDALLDSARDQAYTLEVSPAGILLRARGVTGWRYGLLTLAQLAGEGSVTGASVQDWPALAVRGLCVPRPAASFRSEFRDRLAANLAHWRWNALAFAEDNDWRPPAGTVRLVPAAEVPPERSYLLRETGLYPRFGRVLPEIQEEARARVAAGEAEWWLDLGDLPEGMLVDTLWFGLGFAGCCAWNPARTELKPYRRSFAGFFFGTTNAALPRALQALESAEEALSAAEPGLSRVLDQEDLFAPARTPTTLRLEERAAEAAERAEAALSGFEDAVDGVAANGETVQALSAAAQALGEIGQRLAGLQRAREQYASAHVAASNARAATRRTLAAAEQLDALAGAMRARREEFARAWKRERTDPTPASVGTLLDERAAALAARAEAVREARNRYIQMGSLTAPAAAGMALPTVTADRSLVPERRALRSLPRWWPDGGSARMRVEVEGDAHGLPWEVVLDLRAHAGETGAFNIRSARLALLDDDDNVIDVLPVQLTRRGFVFTPLPRAFAYHLYLDPAGVPAPPPERAVRARQSREGVRIQSTLLTMRLNEAGELVACALPGEEKRTGSRQADEADATVAAEPLLQFAGQRLGTGTRVRVLEPGPLLARVHAESPDGFAVRYDCYGALPGCEVSLNVPVPAVTVRWGGESGTDATPLLAGIDAAPEIVGGGLALSDHLAALLTTTPDATYHGRDSEQEVSSPAGIGSLLLAVVPRDAASLVLAPLLAGIAAPPRVAVGAIEERRVIEF